MMGIIGGGVTHTVGGSFTINAPLNVQLTGHCSEAYGVVAHAIGSNTSSTGTSISLTGASASVKATAIAEIGMKVGVLAPKNRLHPCKSEVVGVDVYIGFHLFI